MAPVPFYLLELNNVTDPWLRQVLCVDNPLLSEEDCGSAVRMLMPGDSPVDYNSPLSLRAKPRTRIPVFTGGSWPSTSSPLAPMKRLGSSLRPSSLRSVARAEQARPEAVEVSVSPSVIGHTCRC